MSQLGCPPVKGGCERAFRERGVAFRQKKTNPPLVSLATPFTGGQGEADE